MSAAPALRTRGDATVSHAPAGVTRPGLGDRDHDVEDVLRGHARDGRAPDVVDPAGRRAQRLDELVDERRGAARPLGVVVDDDDFIHGHGSTIAAPPRPALAVPGILPNDSFAVPA